MTAFPFGASGANPPAPIKATNITHDEPARAVDLDTVLDPDPAVRARRVDDAWGILTDLTATDEELRRACRIIIGLCKDGRRDTAQDILTVLEIS